MTRAGTRERAGKWLRHGALAAFVAAAGWTGIGTAGSPVVSSVALAREVSRSPAGISGAIAPAQLPPEAVATLNAIAAGGPYRYAKDGVVFGNFERLLPPHRRGYYHEYTVPTPRARNRGARRIVCGGPPRRIDNCFYSDDHYNSFKRIVE
ncbi:ribonuclease [Trinickia dinghuensis]|uniref:Ribonuclease n=1 Tax=Trinickia dinghuensis TaxID=2291023 RepID=A0A3D8JNP6_9BURK|nr:ribonuclease [Trinickia dinghuensis]RDU94753.1 ribonuclease [Trinickia dinghuensis]